MDTKDLLDRALDSLRRGDPILLYDSPAREAETDLIYYGPAVTPRAVYELRTKAGAPLVVFLDSPVAQNLGLLPLCELVRLLPEPEGVAYRNLCKDQRAHDCRFALTMDARENKTGCSHVETARTIRVLCEIIDSRQYDITHQYLRIPGHVPIVIAADRLLRTRRGHVELMLTLLSYGKMTPVAVASELVDPETGESGQYAFGREFAEHRGLVFIEGDDIIRFSQERGTDL